MPHPDRPLMNPQPKLTFDDVYAALSRMPGRRFNLITTGGVNFVAEAGVALRASVPDKRVIHLPHGNRIYACCWGNQSNHMGAREGQRIGQYTRPLDDWASGANADCRHCA